MNEDLSRHLIDLAVSAGKKMYREDTGFVTNQEGIIVLSDNFLYALALLRSRTHENMLKARNLLDRLYFFQQLFEDVEEYGSFPVALHEFPRCEDKCQAVHILTVLYWIQKDFGHVINKKLSVVIEKLLSYCEALQIEHFPVWAKVKTAAVLHAFGKKAVFPDASEFYLPDPASLSQMMLAYQLAPSAIDWKPFWHLVAKTWHQGSKRYGGPAFRVFQDQYEQQVTLYDYFMGLFTGSIASVADRPEPQALACALIQPEHMVFESENECHEEAWSTFKTDLFAVSVVEDAPSKPQGSGFSPFYLIAGTHSLCLEVVKGQMVGYEKKNNTYELLIDIDKEDFCEEKNNSLLSFWFDDQKDCSILVSGHKASCFQINEPVTITLGKVKVLLHFEQVLGNSQLVCHINRANRKSQRLLKTRTEAYDTQLFLRAVRGSLPCKIKAILCILDV